MGRRRPRAVRLNGEYVRDEAEQATYLRELLDVFEAEGVDLASRGAVKVLGGQSGAGGRRYPDLPWEPKAAFATLADCYGR